MRFTYGLEEEAFILEPVVPSLASLYYLGTLFWKVPREHYALTNPNLCHLADLPGGVMGGVEVATRVHRDVDLLLADLRGRRVLLRNACPSFIVPVGHLLTGSSRSRTCGFHMHIGCEGQSRRVYRSVVHFLPLLLLLTASSPRAGRGSCWKSARLGQCFAIGPLADDWAYRFQDIIFARRLRTVEVRACDAVWDLERIEHLVHAVVAIAESGREYQLDRDRYNRLRLVAARDGYVDELKPLYRELRGLYDLPEDLLARTAADELRELFERRGLLAAYSAVDSAYRNGEFREGPIPSGGPNPLKAAAGIVGYYLPKAPHALWKVLREL